MHTRLSVWLALLCTPAFAQHDVDLTQISVDNPAKVQVTSVSRKPQSLELAFPAIYVLTAQETPESGFTTQSGTRPQEAGDEYQVEAAYLYNFAKMGRWSAQVLPDRADLIIGVLGGDEAFVKVLRDILVGKEINGHTVEVRYLRSPEDVKSCHLVFFRSAERINRTIIGQLGKSNVLLVGEDKDFLNDGGMIDLTQREGRSPTRSILRPSNVPAYISAIRIRRCQKSDGQIPEVQPESSRSIAFQVMQNTRDWRWR